MVVFLAVVNVAVVVALVAGVVVQHRRICVLESELRHEAGDERVDVLTIRIRNHAELARNRSFFARPLAVVTPGLLRSIVHRETVKMMRAQLVDHGVEADVALRRLRFATPAAPTDADALEDDWPDTDWPDTDDPDDEEHDA